MLSNANHHNRRAVPFIKSLREFHDTYQAKSSASQINISQTKGLSLCAYDAMITHALRQLWSMRYLFNSTMGMSVHHCHELNAHNQDMLKTLIPDLIIIDMCEDKYLDKLGMTRDVAVRRLKGFYCKAGAILLSPFNDVVTIDLDVIWFKNPDIVFHSPAYKKTGYFSR